MVRLFVTLQYNTQSCIERQQTAIINDFSLRLTWVSPNTWFVSYYKSDIAFIFRSYIFPFMKYYIFFSYDFVLCNTLIVVNFINFFAFLQYPIKTNNLLGSDVQKQSVDNFCQSYFNLYRINNVFIRGLWKKSISSVILFPTCLRWQHSFQCQIISWTDAQYLNW
jgi:hypothetical protein